MLQKNRSKLKSKVKSQKTSNSRIVRDAQAHELERELEDRRRRWVEGERRERGLTCRHMEDTCPRVRSTRVEHASTCGDRMGGSLVVGEGEDSQEP
jgi:hypothetical protein